MQTRAHKIRLTYLENRHAHAVCICCASFILLMFTDIMYFSNLHSISKDLWWSTGSVAGHSLIQAPVLDTVLRQGYKLPTAEKKESRPESPQILNSTTKWRFLFWISFFLTKHHQLPFSCILSFSSIHMLHLSISEFPGLLPSYHRARGGVHRGQVAWPTQEKTVNHSHLNSHLLWIQSQKLFALERQR